MFSDKERYFNLRSRRKDGTWVATPLWFMLRDGDASTLYAVTSADTWKVKRVRNFPDVQVAKCTMSGKSRSDWADAKANILEDDDTMAWAHAAMRKKYGWQNVVGDLIEKLTGNHKPRVVIRVSL